ncbi:MAG: 50S ribosomal protein L10, partial [Solirubrobacteraceae bacterium]
MNKDQKAAVIDDIAAQLQAAEAVFAIDFRGLSVAQAADLRAKLRDQNTKFQVVKNSLSERAADKAGVEALKPLLAGPTALVFVQGDAALAAKTLNDTSRALRLLQFKGGLLNGTTLSAEDVVSIARLPPREVLHAQLVGTIAAPLTGLVRGLNALIAGLAIALKQIADEGKLGDGGEAALEGVAATDGAAGEPEAADAAGGPEAADAAGEPE